MILLRAGECFAVDMTNAVLKTIGVKDIRSLVINRLEIYRRDNPGRSEESYEIEMRFDNTSTSVRARCYVRQFSERPFAGEIAVSVGIAGEVSLIRFFRCRRSLTGKTRSFVFTEVTAARSAFA